MPRSIAMLIRHSLVAATTSTSIAATAELMCLIRGPYSIPSHMISSSICQLPGQLVASRAEHTRRDAPAGPDFVYSLYTIYIYISAYCIYILHIVEFQASFGPLNSFDAHELTLTPWRYIIDKANTGSETQRGRERWNCENQKFHSFSYKSVNVCHLSKRPPISASATHSTWSDIQLQLRFAYELKTSTPKNIYFDIVFVFPSLSLSVLVFFFRYSFLSIFSSLSVSLTTTKSRNKIHLKWCQRANSYRFYYW